MKHNYDPEAFLLIRDGRMIADVSLFKKRPKVYWKRVMNEQARRQRISNKTNYDGQPVLRFNAAGHTIKEPTHV